MRIRKVLCHEQRTLCFLVRPYVCALAGNVQCLTSSCFISINLCMGTCILEYQSALCKTKPRLQSYEKNTVVYIFFFLLFYILESYLSLLTEVQLISYTYTCVHFWMSVLLVCVCGMCVCLRSLSDESSLSCVSEEQLEPVMRDAHAHMMKYQSQLFTLLARLTYQYSIKTLVPFSLSLTHKRTHTHTPFSSSNSVASIHGLLNVEHILSYSLFLLPFLYCCFFCWLFMNYIYFVCLTVISDRSVSERDLFTMKVCTDKEFALAGRCIQ